MDAPVEYYRVVGVCATENRVTICRSVTKDEADKLVKVLLRTKRRLYRNLEIERDGGPSPSSDGAAIIE